MSKADEIRARYDYYRAVVDAYSERRLQAGFLAMSELRPQYLKVGSYADFEAWCDQVNELANQILQRPN